jgi:hypothetical protein
MQRVLFHKSHDIENKLLIIIHANKMSVKKKTKFSQIKPRAFFLALRFETHKSKRSPHGVPSPMIMSPNIKANNLFSKNNNNRGVARFQKQIVSNSHQNNFCFQNTTSRFQDSFQTHIPSPKPERREMREW